jgi:xanthine dehydrogenase YagS FAD-binding subunit
LLYEIPSLKHIDVRTVKEAVSCLRKYGKKAKVMAGGTDLLGLIKDRVEGPEVLVNIKPIPRMNRIAYDERRGLKIGGAVTLNRLEMSEVVQEKFPLLADAARQVGTTQIRNMGTIGGNICQRPQCMYFRHPHFLCHKKGGARCYALTGEHRDYYSILGYGKCVMAHPSDMAPALVALKAKAIIAGREGERQTPVEDLFSGPNHIQETVLKADELLLGVQVPNPKGQNFQLFLKRGIRRSSDFALASVAVAAQMSGEICQQIRIVLGGVAPFPYLSTKAQQMIIEKKLTAQLISEAAEASVEGARPLSMNRYKLDLTRALVERALRSVWHEAQTA